MIGENLMEDNSITTQELEVQAQDLVAQANQVLNQPGPAVQPDNS